MSILVISLITFIVCCINPNAISMIYAISGPLIAMILFIMPTLSTYLIPALKPHRSLGNLITLIVGLLCVSVMVSSVNITKTVQTKPTSEPYLLFANFLTPNNIHLNQPYIPQKNITKSI